MKRSLSSYFLFNNYKMAVTSARNIVSLKDKGHFEHKNENARVKKYTLSDELPTQMGELCIGSAMKPGFALRILKVDDKEKIRKFLSRFFFLDEPLNQAVELLKTPESRCVELEDYCTSTLYQNVSVCAVDEGGEIVGVIINGLRSRKNPEQEEEDKSNGCENQKFRRILQVLNYLDREAKVWEKVPPSCEKMMDIMIASTHSDWRGRGLMKALCQESERIAKSKGAGAMRIDTTSAFSAAAAERLNYKMVYSVRYADLDFAPKPDAPHLDARVYIKEI